MTSEHVVGSADAIAPGERRLVDVGGRLIGIFNIDGAFYGLPNSCIHQNGPLCRGMLTGTIQADADSDFKPEWRLDGEVIICPWHSLEFHVRSGRCLAYPDRRLRTYPVRVEDGTLVLSLGTGGTVE